MKVHDPGDIRENNVRRVVEIIRERGAISRADIARETQLSRSTITNIVNDLLPTGLVEETGIGNSYVGRRPIMLEFDYGARLVLGVDMGATHLTIVAANLAGEVLALRREALPVSSQPGRTIERIVTLTNEVREETGYTLAHTLGLGIAVPAPLEGESFDRISPIILPKWMGVDLRREIAAATHLPVFLDNDANLGALAEKWWGHGREVSNLAYIKVGTGVGCGLIINGAIFRGEGGTAGEIGHIAIQADGPPCRCGLRGCLEAMTGSHAIEQRIAQALAAGRASMLAGTPTLPEIVQAARQGDPLATETITDVGRYLGIALATLINLVNPGLIVLGGGLTEASDLLLTHLRQSVRTRTFSKSAAEVTITTSRLGEDAIAIGGATLVIEQVLRSPTIPILHALSKNGRR